MAEPEDATPAEVIEESVDLAKPGESIRCQLTERQARELAKRLYGLTVTGTKEFNGYDDRNFHLSVEGHHENEHIDQLWPHGYVLKIVNTCDSKKPEYLDAQSLMLLHVDERIPGYFPLPVRNVHGNLSSLETIYQEDEDGNRLSEVPTEHVVRILCFIPGIIFHQIPQPDIDLFYETGKFLGRLQNACHDFSNKSLDGRLHLFSMYRVPKLKDYSYAVRDPKRRVLAEEVIDAFIEQVPPAYDRLPKGTIHGDFNEQNILVGPRDKMDANENPTKDTKYKVTGVIDFGDVANGCYIFDIGMTVMYLMTCCKELDQLEVGGHTLAGFLSERTMCDLELDLLKTVVAGRYAQSLVLGEYFYMLDGNEYALTTSGVGWGQLERLWATPKEKVMDIWLGVAEKRRKEHS